MNNRALTLSLFIAVVAVFFVQSYVSSVEEESKKKFGTALLVIKASKDIKEMETVTENMLQFELVPKKFLEPAAISLEKSEEDKESIKTLKGLAGTIAIVPIKKGEQITYNKITEPSMRTGLSPQIAPGKRAVAVPVGEITGVAKLVKPGDRVDIIAILEVGSGKENKVAKTILQDVVVLSIGRYITNNAPRLVEADTLGAKDRVRSLAEDFTFASVTLEVDPTQAQMLVLANGLDGSLTLALRNNDDVERQPINAVTMADLLGTDASRLKGGPGRK